MTREASEGTLAWKVELPGKRSSSLQGRRPRATLVIGREGGPAERLVVPAAVGRLLASKQKAGEVHPASRAELLYIVGELSKTCANARVHRLLNRRDYATQEISQKLNEDGYPTQVIEDVVSYATAIGLVSDARYADVYIRSKLAAGWGIARIERELAQRGICLGDVRGWPYDYLDPDDELQRAIDVAKTRRTSGEHAYQKLVRFLCGRGFTTSVAMRAANRVYDECLNDELVGF